MEPVSFNVSAPGSLMLMGEHAVLHGAHAVVAAVEARIQVTFASRPDNRLVIHSALASYESSLMDPEPHPDLQFVLGAIRHVSPSTLSGLELTIQSEMSSTLGWGSSAAVTAAVVAGMHRIQGRAFDQEKIHKDTCHVIRHVQGSGSGSDAAASVYGGVLLYTVAGGMIKQTLTLPSLALIYCGYKTPTSEVIQHVKTRWEKHGKERDQLYREMDHLSCEVFHALVSGEETGLGSLMDQGQLCMQKLGVSDKTLDRICSALRGDTGIFGAKISGSGLGDCVMGLGTLHLPWKGPGEHLPACLSTQGLHFDAPSE